MITLGVVPIQTTDIFPVQHTKYQTTNMRQNPCVCLSRLTIFLNYLMQKGSNTRNELVGQIHWLGRGYNSGVHVILQVPIKEPVIRPAAAAFSIQHSARKRLRRFNLLIQCSVPVRVASDALLPQMPFQCLGLPPQGVCHLEAREEKHSE